MSGRGKQTLSLNRNTQTGSNCYSETTIMHEFIHALGFHHEQSRPDRDEWVTIHKDRLKPGKFDRNFKKKKFSLTFNIPYDFRSVMHYGSTDFAKTRGQITIEPKYDSFGVEPHELGSARKLTTKDKRKLRAMYGCNDGVCGRSQFHCANDKCVPESYTCDGDNDCGDFSDETICDTCKCTYDASIK